MAASLGLVGWIQLQSGHQEWGQITLEFVVTSWARHTFLRDPERQQIVGGTQA